MCTSSSRNWNPREVICSWSADLTRLVDPDLLVRAKHKCDRGCKLKLQRPLSPFRKKEAERKDGVVAKGDEGERIGGERTHGSAINPELASKYNTLGLGAFPASSTAPPLETIKCRIVSHLLTANASSSAGVLACLSSLSEGMPNELCVPLQGGSRAHERESV